MNKKPIYLRDVNKHHSEYKKKKAEVPNTKRDIISRTMTIVSVDVEERMSSRGNKFNMLVVEYHDGSGEVRKKQTPIFTDEGQMILSNIVIDASFEVRMHKVDGFWRWTKMTLYAGK